MNNFRWYLLVLTFALFAVAGPQDSASAQTNSSAKEQEDAYVREELQRIIKEDPAVAPEAQKALDALNQPETSRDGRQARNRRERGARRIVNGFPSISHPAVGALLKGGDPRSASAWCTGTLVGCDKFLTAAHCIAKDPAPSSYLVFFQELGFFRVKSIRWEKGKYKFPYFDLAMLTLDTPVEGIAPMPINTSVSPLNGSSATIVGFGRTGGTRYDFGIKREGSVKTAACPANMAKDQVLCWHFDADVKPGTSAQNTCNADSGGGIFIRDNDGSRVIEKVFGVVSGGGANNDCMKHDVAYNADVSQYRDWLETAGEGSLSSAMCSKPLWDKTRGPVYTTVRLDAGKPEDSLTVEIPLGAEALHIGMNAEDDNNWKNEFAFVVYGSKPNGEDMCKGSGSGRQFAFCRVEKPEPGTWSIRVSRKKGEGEVQITRLIAGAGR